MAKICQISGKKANSAQHCRHRHSAWKFKAPHKPRFQYPNLQTVTIKTPNGKVRLTVAASVLKTLEFNEVVAGIRPIPKAWLKRATYGV